MRQRAYVLKYLTAGQPMYDEPQSAKDACGGKGYLSGARLYDTLADASAALARHVRRVREGLSAERFIVAVEKRAKPDRWRVAQNAEAEAFGFVWAHDQPAVSLFDQEHPSINRNYPALMVRVSGDEEWVEVPE